MEHIEIREMMPEDAEKLIACMKRTGGETDNLTFGKEGLPATVEQEREYLEPLRRHGTGGGEVGMESGDRRYAS